MRWSFALSHPGGDDRHITLCALPKTPIPTADDGRSGDSAAIVDGPSEYESILGDGRPTNGPSVADLVTDSMGGANTGWGSAVCVSSRCSCGAS